MESSPTPLPPKTTASPAPVSDRLEFVRMYSYIFDHPDWGMTILFGTVCQFIPVIGNLALIGYQYEIVEQLHRGAPRYPAFNFDDFVAYLGRGVWPFLVMLVLSLVLIPVFFIPFVGAGMLLAALDSEQGAAVGLFVFLGLGLLLVVASIALALLLQPMLLRAALTQQFAEGFNLRFARDFVARTWQEMILGMLFLMVSSWIVLSVGAMVFCVGMYLAVTFVFLAQAHFIHQLYAIYLARGGEPIPLRAPAA